VEKYANCFWLMSDINFFMAQWHVIVSPPAHAPNPKTPSHPICLANTFVCRQKKNTTPHRNPPKNNSSLLFVCANCLAAVCVSGVPSVSSMHSPCSQNQIAQPSEKPTPVQFSGQRRRFAATRCRIIANHKYEARRPRHYLEANTGP